MTKRKTDVVIPYDPKILERMQAQQDFARLTPEQRAAKAELLRQLDAVDARLGLRSPVNKFVETLGGSKATKSETSDPDGPVEPNGFRWECIVHRPLSKGPFRFVAHAWLAKDHCVDVDELPEILYDDAEPLLSESAVRNLRDEVNAFLRHHGIPLHAAKRSQKLAILDGPPRGKASRRTR
jgi:hypothetical protein